MKEENVGILVFSQYTLFTSFYCKCTLYLKKKCTLKVHVNRQLFKVKTIIKNSAAFEPVQVFFMDGLFWGHSPWYYYWGVT